MKKNNPYKQPCNPSGVGNASSGLPKNPRNSNNPQFQTTYQSSYAAPSSYNQKPKETTYKKPDPLDLYLKQQERNPMNFRTNMSNNLPTLLNRNNHPNMFDFPKNYHFPHADQDYWFKITSILESTDFTKSPYDNVIHAIERILLNTNKHFQDFSILRSSLQGSSNQEILKFITELVLKTPQIFDSPTSLLTENSKGTVILSRRQCACLLANMFMCTTKRQNFADLPQRFNFSELYSSSRDPKRDQVKFEKLSCIFNYFKTLLSNKEHMNEQVIFQRLQFNEKIHGSGDLSSWVDCKEILQDVHVDKDKIEHVPNAVEVDFANKYLGGGVLGGGSVQEEIQFITRPEQIVGVLFCGPMKDDEAIRIKGARVYSNYQGYANTFEWMPTMEIEDEQREVIAIDAQDFQKIPSEAQFEEYNILRETNKAYVGFYGDLQRDPTMPLKPVSTGAWGCGIFKGDYRLKFLIQWMAASRAGRKMVYHCADLSKKREIQNMIGTYKGKSVGMLMKEVLSSSSKMKKPSLDFSKF